MKKSDMKKYYMQRVFVSGSGSFPLDMLRYDSACAEDESQTPLIGDRDGHRLVRLRRFAVEPDRLPGVDRWKSFGWRVVTVADEDGHVFWSAGDPT